MVPVAIAGNILGEATPPAGNIFNEAMRPWRSSVSTVIRRCGLKTFTPPPPDQKGAA